MRLICRVCGTDLEGQEVEAHTAKWHPRMWFGGWKEGETADQGEAVQAEVKY